MTNLYRLLLILSALAAGVLNGAPIAAPVLIFMVYLSSLAVRYFRQARRLYTQGRAL